MSVKSTVATARPVPRRVGASLMGRLANTYSPTTATGNPVMTATHAGQNPAMVLSTGSIDQVRTTMPFAKSQTSARS